MCIRDSYYYYYYYDYYYYDYYYYYYYYYYRGVVIKRDFFITLEFGHSMLTSTSTRCSLIKRDFFTTFAFGHAMLWVTGRTEARAQPTNFEWVCRDQESPCLHNALRQFCEVADSLKGRMSTL